MENASKALIIAGAILLSILLISLGIMVYNNAKGTISDANIDQETAQAFNTKISQYCGNGKNAATMNSLMDAISSSNGAQNGKSSANGGHYIDFDVEYDKDSTGTVKKLSKTGIGPSSVSDGITYPVCSSNYTYNATYVTNDNGYISKVTVKIKN